MPLSVTLNRPCTCIIHDGTKKVNRFSKKVLDVGRLNFPEKKRHPFGCRLFIHTKPTDPFFWDANRKYSVDSSPCQLQVRLSLWKFFY